MEVVCGGEGDPECKKMREVEVVCGYLATKLYSLGLGCVIQSRPKLRGPAMRA